MDTSIVFFDIDGTIWDYQGKIPGSAVRAIRQLRSNGHYAFLCSGRSRVTIRAKELLDIGFDGVLAGCGTYVEYQGKVLFEYRLPWELLSRTLCVMKQGHLAAMYEGSRKLYVDQEAFGEDAYIAQLKETLGEDFCDIKHMDENSIVNKMCVDYRHSTRERMMQCLGGDYEVILHVFGPVAELLPKGFSKATGMARVCDYLGMAQQNTYAFGDSANDVDMLLSAGQGIAMGNASQDAKDVADYVTASMYEDGIEKGLKHFRLI